MSSSSSSDTPTCLEIKELPTRSGQDTVGQGTTTGTRQRQYRLTFDAKATENDCFSASAGGFTMPSLWTQLGTGTYEQIYWLLDRKADAVPGAKPPATVWIVTLNYSIPQPGQSKPDATKNKWNVNISISSVVYEQEVFKDANNKPIINSAGQQFSPSLKTAVYDERITLSYDTYNPDWSTLTTCRGKANDASISLTINGHARTFATNTLKLDTTEMQGTVDAYGAGALKMTLQLFYRADTWTNKVVDQGQLYMTTDGKLVNAVDSNNVAIPTHTFLDGTGKKLAGGADAYQLSFTMVPTTSFTTLLTNIST